MARIPRLDPRFRVRSAARGDMGQTVGAGWGGERDVARGRAVSASAIASGSEKGNACVRHRRRSRRNRQGQPRRNGLPKRLPQRNCLLDSGSTDYRNNRDNLLPRLTRRAELSGRGL